ncbi:bZIP transcription factor 11-like [Actinidia eriantha]|uniref:bZIP transcription factor 11-like n=1 Tax=Actinidia eriantha TaxID=165200 RepID=UPI002587D92D|nr:bZIP transcription factor 11-like [Actinidia eriantha]
MPSASFAMPVPDGFFGIPFPAFEGGFTPWDYQEPLFPFPPQEPASFLQEPVLSHSGPDNSKPNPVTSNSSSNPDTNNSSPGSDDTNRPGPLPTDRRLRRMISNRESARRSRMRKKKHLENLRNHLNRLRVGKRELNNRLHFLTHHSEIVRRQNQRLASEADMLRQRLWAIHQVLLVRELQHVSPPAWPCNTIRPLNEQMLQIPPSQII